MTKSSELPVEQFRVSLQPLTVMHRLFIIAAFNQVMQRKDAKR